MSAEENVDRVLARAGRLSVVNEPAALPGADLLTGSEGDALAQIIGMEGVVAAELLDREGATIEVIEGAASPHGAVHSSVLDMASLVAAELGERSLDAAIVIVTGDAEMRLMRLSTADALVTRARARRSAIGRMTHGR
ncbi:MAG: hypothetical protein AAFZ09_14715 [Pseudomonadota bacterium]